MENSVLKVIKEQDGRNVRVLISGEIDIYTSQAFKNELNEVVNSCTSDVYMDCKELSYIDSTGLGILVSALKQVQKENNDIYICNLKENIKKLFIITGLDKLFKIEE